MVADPSDAARPAREPCCSWSLFLEARGSSAESGKARVLARWPILTPWEDNLQALEPPRQEASAPAEHLTELKFSELELAPEVQRGIADAGFTYCTPIQSKTLPVA